MKLIGNSCCQVGVSHSAFAHVGEQRNYFGLFALYVVSSIGAEYALPFLQFSTKRLSGEPVYLWDVLLQQGSPLVFALTLASVARVCLLLNSGGWITQGLLISAKAACLAGKWVLVSYFAIRAIQAENPSPNPLWAMGVGRCLLLAGRWAALTLMISLDAEEHLQMTRLRRLLL